MQYRLKSRLQAETFATKSREKKVMRDEPMGDPIKRALQSDPVYRRAKKSLENIMQLVSSDRVMEELFALQASRAVTALKPNKLLQSRAVALIDSSVQEIAVRSRASTIKMEALRSLLTLEEIVDPLRKYIIHTYGAQMAGEGRKTVAAQRASVDTYLKLFLRETRRLDYILRITDLVISDTDAAGWALKRITDVLETTSKER